VALEGRTPFSLAKTDFSKLDVDMCSCWRRRAVASLKHSSASSATPKKWHNILIFVHDFKL
jgi:hypothetical protein